MKNQEYIKNLCLIGADRQQIELSKLEEPISLFIRNLSEQGPAENILHALTLDHFYRVAGNDLPTLDKPVSLMPVIEQKKYAPENFYKVLNQILDIDKQQLQSQLIASWISKLKDYNFIVHPIYLVKYLNTLLKKKKKLGIWQYLL